MLYLSKSYKFISPIYDPVYTFIYFALFHFNPWNKKLKDSKKEWVTKIQIHSLILFYPYVVIHVPGLLVFQYISLISLFYGALFFFLDVMSSTFTNLRSFNFFFLTFFFFLIIDTFIIYVIVQYSTFNISHKRCSWLKYLFNFQHCRNWNLHETNSRKFMIVVSHPINSKDFTERKRITI